MPSIYDGSPLELVENAITYGERDLRQAREYLAECERTVAAAKISVEHHTEHLARWQAAHRLINSPLAHAAAGTSALLPGPEPVCVYGCGTTVHAEGDWCMRAECRDAWDAQSGGDK